MKNFVFILIFVIHGQFLFSQVQKDFNGWEFLEWNSKKRDVEKTLKDKNIEIQETYSEAAYDKITRFHYNDFNTWLYFDSLNQLDSVEQYKEFSVIQDEEANSFYEMTEKYLVQKFGKPDLQTNNTTAKLITLKWNLKFTKVQLTYDYKYKIIDEFGCCSYKVDILYKPIYSDEK